MAAFKKLKLAGLAIGSMSLVPILLSACSSNSNQTPPVYGNTDAGDATVAEGGTPGTDAESEAEPEASVPSGDASDAGIADALEDAPSNDAQDAAGDGGTDAAPPCNATLSDAGCWVCPSASDGSVEFLNQCFGTGVKCVSFDNLTRLPGFDAGLPPLN
jgi:hypothetical protein